VETSLSGKKGDEKKKQGECRAGNDCVRDGTQGSLNYYCPKDLEEGQPRDRDQDDYLTK